MTNGNQGIPVHVGKCIVRLDKIYHNFGEIKPNSKLECTFRITNTGRVPVELGKPITPCTCTSTLIQESTKLQPGTTLPLGVSLQSRNVAGFQHLVLLRFREKEGSLPRQVSLSLFGSQRELKRISTNMLNFGIVIPGRSYSRTVLMEEVATDRFSIKGFAPGKYPITYKVEEKIGSEGYHLYRIVFELTPDDTLIGKQDGQIMLMTDSRFAPEVPIDLAFEVPPLLSLQPSILSFGDVYVEKPVERWVRFVPRTAGHVSVEIDTPPPGVKVRIGESSNGQTELYVTLSLPKTGTWKETGIWKGTIKGKARVGERTLPIEIPCVAVGIES